ncbi:Argininosuccinate synthase [Colletotrichum sp. SAR11_240]|nr:Argininosuccinate synthase [Colletotrichum sp. SAR11_240]
MSKGKLCLAYSAACYIADVGQEESDWDSVEKKALQIGATKLIVDDLKREFVEELCWKAVQCNAVYESLYLLGIPVSSTKAKSFSMDDNFAHCSYEAGVLEDPNVTPPEDMWTKTVSPLNAPDAPLDITIDSEKGTPVKVVTPQQISTDSVELFGLLNRIGGEHGVGRIDIVENRFIGLKSRGCYDSPAMTILRLAHISIEGL